MHLTSQIVLWLSFIVILVACGTARNRIQNTTQLDLTGQPSYEVTEPSHIKEVENESEDLIENEQETEEDLKDETLEKKSNESIEEEDGELEEQEEENETLEDDDNNLKEEEAEIADHEKDEIEDESEEQNYEEEADDRSDIADDIVDYDDPHRKPKRKNIENIFFTTLRPVSYSSVVYDPDEKTANYEFSGSFYGNLGQTTPAGEESEELEEPTILVPKQKNVQTPLSGIKYQNPKLFGYDFEVPYDRSRTQVPKPYVMLKTPKYTKGVYHSYEVREPEKADELDENLRNAEADKELKEEIVGERTSDTTLKSRPNSSSPISKLFSEENTRHKVKESYIQKFNKGDIIAPKYFENTQIEETTKSKIEQIQEIPLRTHPTDETIQKPVLQKAAFIQKNKTPEAFVDEGFTEASFTNEFMTDSDDIYNQVLANIESVFGGKLEAYPQGGNVERPTLAAPIVADDYESHLTKSLKENSFENVQDEVEKERPQVDEEVKEVEEIKNEELENEELENEESENEELENEESENENSENEDLEEYEDEEEVEESHHAPENKLEPARTNKQASQEYDKEVQNKPSLVFKRLVSESTQQHKVTTDSIALPTV